MKKRCMLSVYQKSEKKHRCFRVCTSHRLGIEFTCLRHDIGTAGGSGAARGCGGGGVSIMPCPAFRLRVLIRVGIYF